jgi:hypothetical protein
MLKRCILRGVRHAPLQFTTLARAVANELLDPPVAR